MADMARRELLTDDERGRLFGIPEGESELIRHTPYRPPSSTLPLIDAAVAISSVLPSSFASCDIRASACAPARRCLKRC